MVPYAGFDPSEIDINAPVLQRQPAAKRRTRKPRFVNRKTAIRAHDLFQRGYDTMQVATALGVGFTEANAEKLVSVGRSIMLGKPLPYKGARS